MAIMDSEMSKDTRDLTAAAAGDSDAFARLYERHAGVVQSLCRRYGSNHEADDAAQETFFRAFHKLDQLAEPAGFRPWLYSIARRVCAERRRSAQRRDRHEAGARVRLKLVQPDCPSPAETAAKTEQLDRLSTAIDGLPEDERLAIHLYYIDEDPVMAAKEALGLSRSGFYKLLYRARQRLSVSMREAKAI
jgi:RNA polymerase sigma-70 factor (ECF subfamily)